LKTRSLRDPFNRHRRTFIAVTPGNLAVALALPFPLLMAAAPGDAIPDERADRLILEEVGFSALSRAAAAGDREAAFKLGRYAAARVRRTQRSIGPGGRRIRDTIRRRPSWRSCYIMAGARTLIGSWARPWLGGQPMVATPMARCCLDGCLPGASARNKADRTRWNGRARRRTRARQPRRLIRAGSRRDGTADPSTAIFSDSGLIAS